MSAEKPTSKHRKLTVRFNENYNKKLYGNYFTTIRKKDCDIQLGNFYEIELRGKVIMSAQAIAVATLKFHELSELSIIMDTGVKYSQALDLFRSYGYNVSNFDLEVKYILFAVSHVYTNKQDTV